MWHGKGKTAIVGIGYSELMRQSKRPLGLLALDACREAIADAGLSPQQIDGLATYPEAPFLGAGTRDGVDIVTVKDSTGRCVMLIPTIGRNAGQCSD